MSAGTAAAVAARPKFKRTAPAPARPKRSPDVGLRAFLGAIGVIALLMLGTYLLTFLIPGGEYPRILNEAGNLVLTCGLLLLGLAVGYC